METLNIYEAKTDLSRLVARAEAGETILLARRGIPAAQLGPIQTRQNGPVFDDLAGQVYIAEDFDEWGEGDERMWFGE